MRCPKSVFSCILSMLLTITLCIPLGQLAYAAENQHSITRSDNEISIYTTGEDDKGKSSVNSVPAVPSAGAGRTVNVKTVGAKGDGKTDDTKALNDALRKTSSQIGTMLTVTVPKGTYIISDSLGIYSNTILKLEDGATIKSVAVDGSMLSGRHYKDDGKTLCYDSTCKHGSYSQLSNITIIGGTWDRNDLKGQGASYGITLRHASDIAVQGVTFTNSVDHMLNLSANKNAKVENCIFKNSIFSKNYKSSFWDISISRVCNPENPKDYNDRHRFSEVLHFDFANQEGESLAFPIDNTPCENCMVTNCTFEDVHAGIGTHHNNVNRSNGLKISGCSFKNIFGQCINVQCFSGVEISNINANAVGGLLWADNSVVAITGTDTNSVYCTSHKPSNNNGVTQTLNAIQAQNKARITLSAPLTLNNPSISGVYLEDSLFTNTGELKIVNPKRFGVRAINKSTATLNNVTVKTPNEQGLSVSGVGSKITAKQCLVDNATGSALYADTQGVLVVENSTVTNSMVGAAFSGSGEGCSIKSTKITGCSSNGVQITNNCGSLTLANNTISNSGGHGIYIANNNISKTITVSNNAISNPGNGKSAVSVSEKSSVVIDKNTISNLSTTGFGVIGSGSSKVSVTNNTITGDVEKKTPKFGILLTDCTANCEVKSNIVQRTYGPGIAVTRSNKAQVSSNTVKDAYDNGIVVTDSSGVNVAKNTSTSKYSVNADIRINNGVTESSVNNNTVGTRGISSNPNSKISIYSNKVQAESGTIWKRLWGQTQFDTMKEIVNEGWSTSGTVVIATAGGFEDALSASGVAGLENAPVLLVNKNSVPGQTTKLLQTLKPKKVIIAGGTGAISKKVADSIQKTTGVVPKRIFGQTATDTAAELNKAYANKWSGGIAILATNKSYYDALSAAPLSYAKHYPIFLSEGKEDVSAKTISAMKACNIKQVIVVGGTGAIKDKVVTKLKNNGITLKDRLWGQTQYDTSEKIASWAIKNGMGANYMGVATGASYYDALCGAALCGKNNAVLVLTEKTKAKNTSIAKNNKAGISKAYVFGGAKGAVSDSVMKTFEDATK